MGGVTRSVRVSRPVDEVAKVATDPNVVFPMIGGFGKFDRVAQHPDGSEEWDLHLDVGSIHVGSRVLVEPPSGNTLVWESQRGTRHKARIEVSQAEDGAVISMTVSAEFGGLLAGWLTGVLANGILGRHIVAGLEQLRHHIEYAS